MPDDLPHDYILETSPGRTWASSLSMPSDWTPLKHYVNNFDGYQPVRTSTGTIPWQFKNFLITDGD